MTSILLVRGHHVTLYLQQRYKVTTFDEIRKLMAQHLHCDDNAFSVSSSSSSSASMSTRFRIRVHGREQSRFSLLQPRLAAPVWRWQYCTGSIIREALTHADARLLVSPILALLSSGMARPSDQRHEYGRGTNRRSIGIPVVVILDPSSFDKKKNDPDNLLMRHWGILVGDKHHRHSGLDLFKK